MRQREIFPPVTMGHIRSHGVTRLLVYCGNAVWCHHSAMIDGDFLSGETQLIPLERLMVCTRYGFTGDDVRPDWTQARWAQKAEGYRPRSR
jgi:hypothetical protein